ncbi:adenylate/guanylate cyclase domain-containing protein [Prosthecomicrobium sp. N25]|uniref:adenylate/guanylate cyclase domain-containing protein n=1 Tax=Prosthecomicrobium sp. N25 TaxID=3129254 RepID=UPI0030778A33
MVAWRDDLRSLFTKYLIALFLAVAVPLTANGIVEAWFAYQDQRARLDALLGVEARGAANRIGNFVQGISDQLGWLVQLPWTEEIDERRQIDALRLLRQVPAVVNLMLVDGLGRERVYVSRVGLNRTEGRTDHRRDAAVEGARSRRLWYGQVTYNRGSEPYMTVAMAGNRPSVGIAVADVNLKLIWDVISVIRVGNTGYAFVLDELGRLIAHPDLGLVLKGDDEDSHRPFRAIREALGTASFATAVDAQGLAVAAASASVAGPGWTVVVVQPLAEAYGPIYAAIWRTAVLLISGLALAALLAWWLANRLSGPIRLLEKGTKRIGAGEFGHRVEIDSGDELQRLAESFNAMAEGLALSLERQERIDRLKRFLAPQVAELVDRSGDGSLLEARRTLVVALFCDLRGFTAFSAKAPPEEVMKVLSDYYEALGRVIAAHEATLASFTGDGVMVLVNAPVSADDPGRRALDLAADMQTNVQALVALWRMQGHRIGFGVGLAMGEATVGRVGNESRSDYTAIGSVVNLASRLCSAAADGEILVDRTLADVEAWRDRIVDKGSFTIKGFDDPIAVFALTTGQAAS